MGKAVAAVGIAKVALTGHLLVNITASIPRGIYWISPNEVPRQGQLVALPIPEEARELLYERQYLPRSVRLLAKPVAAVGGEHVCVRNRSLFVNGERVGDVLGTDREGRAMPHHAMCETLAPDQLFLAARHGNSFDSRNFGPITVQQIRGTLTPLLTF